MPELPEVETICTNLRIGTQEHPSIVGLDFSSIEVLWQRSVAAPAVDEFCRRLPGQRIREIGRRGKYLVLTLSNDVLIVHLRMSGDLFVETQSVPAAPHHRVVLNLEGGWRLAFNDARKFGRLWLVSDPNQVTGSLGPEPLDEKFTAQDFYQRLKSRNRQLKPLLLDQSFLAGLGNIYTDEALYQACLHPLTNAKTLSFEQAERLWRAIRQVLEEGIRHNGASLDWVYRGGDFQNYFQVYQRTGEPCQRCEAPIQRIVVGQRGTHFCPECQKR